MLFGCLLSAFGRLLTRLLVFSRAVAGDPAHGGVDRLAEGEAQGPGALHVAGGDQGEYFRHLRLVAGRNFAVFGDGIGDAFADRRAVGDQGLRRFLAALLALDQAVGAGGGQLFLLAVGEGR